MRLADRPTDDKTEKHVKFLRFMNTPTGRGIRMVGGVALIAAGARMGGPAGWSLAAFGLLPFATGATGICPISPLVGEPMRGSCGVVPPPSD